MRQNLSSLATPPLSSLSCCCVRVVGVLFVLLQQSRLSSTNKLYHAQSIFQVIHSESLTREVQFKKLQVPQTLPMLPSQSISQPAQSSFSVHWWFVVSLLTSSTVLPLLTRLPWKLLCMKNWEDLTVELANT